MSFELPLTYYDEDYMNLGYKSQSDPLLPCYNTDFDNSNFLVDTNNFDASRDNWCDKSQYDVHVGENYRENSFTSDEVLDDDLSLMNGSTGMYDVASLLKFDNSMEDHREPRDNMFSRYENLAAYRRKWELEDIIMKERIIRSQSDLNSLDPTNNGCSRLYCLGGALLVLPNGNVHVTPTGQVIPTIDIQVPSGWPLPVPSSQRQSVYDWNLKRQWRSRRNSGYHPNSGNRSKRNSPMQNRNVKTHLSSRSDMDSNVPIHRMDDEVNLLLWKTTIKVRNIHPTACLHELHVQRRELFPKKPVFNMTKFLRGTQKKGSFSVQCIFEFNGGKLYTYDRQPTKNDAKMNAARSMLRKLKAIPNLTISLDDEKTNSGTFWSFEHPRCQLLHLHDTNPEMYPVSPTFQANFWRTQPGSRKTTKRINMSCHFQVGKEKLVSIGIANNKKQAIVQAARNMLKQCFPNQVNLEESRAEGKHAALDRKNTPWACHFCNIFMTGRKPFLSHLTGRSHTQRMSELELNAEEENKRLEASVEEKCKKMEEEKRNAAIRSCNQQVGAQLQSNSNKTDFDCNSVMNTSSQDLQESEGTCKNTCTSSSEMSEFEANYYLPVNMSNKIEAPDRFY
jgi:hypothetical protein